MIKWFGSLRNFNTIESIPIGNIKSIALVSMLIALSVAGRLLFSFIPNVQPATAIIIITTLILGVKYGMINAVLSILISNLVLGTGTWTIAQIVSFAVIVLITGYIIRPLSGKLPHFAISLFAGICGFVYGFFISLIQAPIFGFKYFWAYYLAGIPFDIAHAVGNVAFYYVLAPIMFPLIGKLLTRYFSNQILSSNSLTD